MKKISVILTVLAFALSINTVILIKDSNEKAQQEQQARSGELEIDPKKDCPQNDRNCNGIPDHEENN